jgi:trigger factor
MKLVDMQHLECCALRRVGSNPTRAMQKGSSSAIPEQVSSCRDQERQSELKLEVAVADLAQCEKELTIEVPAEEVKTEFDKTSRAYAQHAQVPGFRPGHAPLTIVKQRFNKDIKEEVLNALVSHALQHAIVDHKLRVIGSPDISEVTLKDGEPLRFKASVEVLPEFELREYKGLKATKRVAAVTDEDVDRVFENWRERAAQLVPVEDRPAEDGDLVSVKLVGKYLDPTEEHEKEDLKSEDVVIEIGAAEVQPEFSDNLRGVKVGDERQFRVVYPEDFTSKGLAGKTLDFTATVDSVRQKELPELDDDFAKEFGGEESLAELRQKVRDDLVKSAESRAEAGLRESTIDSLLGNYDFGLPDSIVESQAQELLQEFAYRMISSGVPPQSLQEMNWDERRGTARVRAVRDVRTALILERIGEAEKISVSAGELQEEIERIALQSGQPVEAVMARLTKEERLSSIESRLRHHKILEFIVNNAEVTTEEITETQTPEIEPPTEPTTEQS